MIDLLFIATFGLGGTGLAILGSGVLGAGATLYGANKQAKANKSAQEANRAAQAEADRINWQRYLMQRGINGTGAATGQMPQNAPVVNARLPLWMMANRGGGPVNGRVVRRIR